eukprot:10796289-Prorocentrum_lima.AAC.1
MTSSLVGSEMCIRDRISGNIVIICMRESRRAPSPRTLAVPARITRTVPVSYTHLTLPTICSV